MHLIRIENIEVVLKLAFKNIKRWKWRLFGISLLIALALALHVLYAASIERSIHQKTSVIQELNLPIDLMVIVPEGERLLSEAEWPATKYLNLYGKSEPLHDIYEKAVKLSADSAIGELSLLGIEADSEVFKPSLLDLEGAWLKNDTDIVLPHDIAINKNMHVGDLVHLSAWQNSPHQQGLHAKTFRLVGTYKAEFSIQAALIHSEAAKELLPVAEENCFFIDYRRNTANPIVLEDLISWVSEMYPRAQLLHSATTKKMGENLLGQAFQPSHTILFLIVLFVGIGVLTIAVMTFLERRKELAALKTIGISHNQVTGMLILEYTFAAIVGFTLGITLLLPLIYAIDWLWALGFQAQSKLILSAAAALALTLLLAIAYPIFTARIASVNQLLYARRIPLASHRTDHMDNPLRELVYRERQENLRILKLLPQAEANDVLIFKQEGNTVKKGEVIATQERYFGYFITEWLSPCDGRVQVRESNGVIGIRPSDEKEPFYPYPVQMLEGEQRFRRSLEIGTEEARTSLADLDAHSGETALQYQWERTQARQLGVIEKKMSSKITDYAQQARMEQTRTAPSKKRTWLKITALGLSLALIYVALDHDMKSRHRQQQARAYQTVAAILDNVRHTVHGQGVLEAAETKKLLNSVPGYLQEILVNSGDYINEGQVIALLDNPELVATYNKAQCEWAQAQQEYDAQRIFYQNTRIADTESYLSFLQKQGNSASASERQEKLKIYAPASGWISEIFVEEGNEISFQDSLISLFDSQLLGENEAQLQLLEAKINLTASEKALNGLILVAPEDGRVTKILYGSKENIDEGDSVIEMLPSNSISTTTIEQARLTQEHLLQAIDSLTVRAKHSGFVRDIDIQVGDTVSENDVLAWICDDNSMLMTIAIPQSQITLIDKNAAVEIHVSQGNHRINAQIHEIASEGQLNPQDLTVIFPVDICLSNDGGFLDAGSPATAIIIPSSDSNSSRHLGPFRGELRYLSETPILAPSEAKVKSLATEDCARVETGQIILELQNDTLYLEMLQAGEKLQQLQSTILSASSSGSIAAVYVSEGQMVQKGDLLLALENTAIYVAYKQAQKSYVDLSNHQQGNTTIKSAVDGGVADILVAAGDYVEKGQLLIELHNPALDYDMNRTTWDEEKALAQLRATESNLLATTLAATDLALRQAEIALQKARQDLETLRITAPVSGRIDFLQQLQLGMHLPAHQEIAFISSNQMQLTIQVDEQDIRLLQIGDEAELRVAAYPNIELSATVREIASVGSVMGENVAFSVIFAIAEDERLRAGMSATADIVLQEANMVITIPRSFLHMRRDHGVTEYFVHRYLDGKLIDTPVIVGLITKEVVEIQQGLREGEVIAMLLPP